VLPTFDPELARAELARESRKAQRSGDSADAERVEQLRRDYQANITAARVRDLLDQAPPLPDAIRTELAAILRPGAGGS
jgi:hypothetical protein